MSAAAGALVESVARAAGNQPSSPGDAASPGASGVEATTHAAEEAPMASGDELETGGLVSAGIAPVGVAPSGAVPGGLAPGAYLPPSTVNRPAPPPATPPQMPLAASPSVGAPPPPPTAGWSPPAPPPPPQIQAPIQAGRASLFADLPFDAPDSLTEWLVAVGSGVATLSFLLPWIPGTTSYETSWGLASISRLPILAVLVITAVLAILPNRVALWVRAGILGLIGGSLFVGILWPIVAGDFGDAAFGAVIGAAAGVILVVGGILAVAPRKTTATE